MIKNVLKDCTKVRAGRGHIEIGRPSKAEAARDCYSPRK